MVNGQQSEHNKKRKCENKTKGVVKTTTQKHSSKTIMLKIEWVYKGCSCNGCFLPFESRVFGYIIVSLMISWFTLSKSCTKRRSSATRNQPNSCCWGRNTTTSIWDEDAVSIDDLRDDWWRFCCCYPLGVACFGTGTQTRDATRKLSGGTRRCRRRSDDGMLL